jgi:hypothetical protein
VDAAKAVPQGALCAPEAKIRHEKLMTSVIWLRPTAHDMQ